MNKEEFLRQLEQLLSGISEEERADAVAFYRSYFEDAGEENEASIIEELETPQKVADSILKNFGIDTKKGTDGDSKYYNTFANRDAAYYQNVNQAVNNLNGNPAPKKDNTGMTVLIVILAVLTSPIWLTLLVVIASIALGLVCVLFGIAIAAIAVMVSLICVGFVLAGVGFSVMFTGNPVAGIGLIGGGFLVLALGILSVLLVVLVCGGFLPWAVKGIWNLCKKPFNKRKERAAA